MTLVFVVVGGGVGAVARYVADRAIAARVDEVFPWGTFAVNVVGALILGLLSGAASHATGVPDWLRALIGTGFCGALTTYSTFALETTRLWLDGAWRYAAANAAATLAVGLAAAGLGWALAS
jgi:CrcB protein